MIRPALLLGLAALALFVRPSAAQERIDGLPQQRVVRQLSFEGNKALEDAVLASAIGTTRSSWFASSPLVSWLGLGEKRFLDEQELRRDVVRLEVLYRRSGFPDATVDTTVRRTERDAFISFRIDEGEPIRVTAFQVTGLDSLPAWLRRVATTDLPLRQGDPFNRYLMQASADTIANRLRNRGYPSARVFSSFETTRASGTASVTLEADPGERAVIGAVRVEGARRVDTATVRKMLVTQPGRRYSQEEVFESQRNLYRGELFRFATVNVDSVAWTPGDTMVPLVVRVAEGRRRRIRGGLGYGTNDCFRTSLGWTSRNFFGGGRIFDVSARASKLGIGEPFDWGLSDGICGIAREDTVGSSKVNYNVTVAVRRPVFLSPRNSITVSAFTERRSEYKVYLRQETGASIGIDREAPRRRMPMSLYYRLSYGRTDATPFAFCAYFNACTPEVIDALSQGRVLATLTGRATQPRLNNPLDPSRGSLASLEVTLSSRFIGSSPLQEFTRVVGEYAWYRPVGEGMVLATRLRGGIIFAPRVEIAGASSAFIPPEQRFYAGGPNDVRGFERNELGPVVYVTTESHVNEVGGDLDRIDPDSVQVAATGGNTLALGNLELRFPSPVFGSRLRLAAFVDVGGTWLRNTPESPVILRITPGIGLRIATPLGPARLDLGYNPYRLQPGTLYQRGSNGELEEVPGGEKFVRGRDGKITFHLAVGQPF